MLSLCTRRLPAAWFPKGAWITPDGTVTGHNLYTLWFRISRMPRWGGALGSRGMTVAVHSLFVRKIVQELGGGTNAQDFALIHDLTEGALGDMPAPIKPLLQDYTLMESKLADAIALSLKLVVLPHEYRMVKQADGMAACWEAGRTPGELGLPDILKASLQRLRRRAGLRVFDDPADPILPLEANEAWDDLFDRRW